MPRRTRQELPTAAQADIVVLDMYLESDAALRGTPAEVVFMDEAHQIAGVTDRLQQPALIW